MEKLIEAIIELVSDSPPDKAEQLAEAIRRLSGAQNAASLTSWANKVVLMARCSGVAHPRMS